MPLVTGPERLSFKCVKTCCRWLVLTMLIMASFPLERSFEALCRFSAPSMELSSVHSVMLSHLYTVIHVLQDPGEPLLYLVVFSVNLV